jgi:glycosyltransferase involved in cell wall biosynthesis
VRRKRILHLINTLSSGGAERQLVTYLRQESLHGYENIVVLLDIEDVDSLTTENFLVPEIKAEGIQVLGLGLSGSGNWIRAARKLRTWLKANPVDLIHTNLLGPNVVGRLAGYFTKTPVLTTYHNLDYSEEATIFHFSGSRFKLIAMRQIDSFLAKRTCSRVIAVSQCVADHITDQLGYDSRQIRVINNPVDLNHMKVIQKNPKSWVCEQLNIGTEAIVFIDICRFVYQKNLPRLLDAFQGVVEFNPDAHLVLIGSTQNTEVYKEVCDRITELGITNQVHVVGPSLQVADWLAGSDIFVFPSLVEGMGIALAEAMSIGLPCISSNVGPIPEFIKNRENGLLVDPKSKTEIASAMIELLSNPEFAKQLGSRAKSTVDEMFNPYRQAQKLVALYEEIFAETARKRRSIANT